MGPSDFLVSGAVVLAWIPRRPEIMKCPFPRHVKTRTETLKVCTINYQGTLVPYPDWATQPMNALSAFDGLVLLSASMERPALHMAQGSRKPRVQKSQLDGL